MAFSSFVNFLVPQNFTSLIILVTLIIVPFLTYFISTTLFYRTARSHSALRRPPTVPYWVPGIYHGFSLLSRSPSIFFKRAIKEYGNFAPFAVHTGSSRTVVLRDPKHIERVFDAPTQMIKRQNRTTGQVHSAISHELLSGQHLASMSDKYTSILRHNLANKMFQERFWTEIEDLWTFFENEVSRAISETLFGSVLLKQYRRIVRDFWEYHASIETISSGIPRFLVPSSYAAQDRLLENLEKWLRLSEEEAGDVKADDDEAGWSEKMGFKLLRASEKADASKSSTEHSERALGALYLMRMALTDTVPATVWCIIETLQNPALLKHMPSEMKRHITASKKSYDVSAIASIPVIQSMLAEIGRLRTATASIRTNVVDGFKLDDQWVIPKSWNTVVFSQDLALNTELWAKARPSTVDRPLGEFWAERFLVSEKATRYHNSKTGTGKFSMEGIDTLWTVFGGGQHACAGRGLANAIQAGTLAVLMNEYEMDLSEPDAVEEAMPPVGGIIIGVIKPIAKIRVRIRKRMTSK